MQKMTFYEQIGIVIPGALLLFGLFLYFPSLQSLIGNTGVSVGELGLFLLISYAAGHFIAAIANLIENLFWSFFGGMPSLWVVNKRPTILSPQQLEQLRLKIASRLQFDFANLYGIERTVWFPICRQVYADVAKNGKPDRIDTFNGNYGLNRGLMAACLTLASVGALNENWEIVVGLLVCTAVYGYRAYRFGVYYARELYLQFLIL